MEKKISTWLSQDACFGVKCATNLGCAASHVFVALAVWDEPLSSTRCTVGSGGRQWSRRRRKAVKCAEVFRGSSSTITWPVCTSKAAVMDAVPCLTYSNSRRLEWPGRAERSGCLRERAAIAVFSSTDTTIEPAGQDRYRSQISAAFSKNAGSSGRVSHPRTRCGFSSSPARIRPTCEDEIPLSASSAAISRWDQLP